MSAVERFFAQVEPIVGGCWLWTGYQSERGYGRFFFEGKRRMAHRVAYEWFVGPIGEGLEPDHLCRQRLCVNPTHIEPVTRKVNILRGTAPTARNAAKKRCNEGHEFTPENTLPYHGFRICRTCQNEANRAYRWRKRNPVAA